MATQTAEPSDLVLTPPEPVATVSASTASGLVPLDDGQKTALEAKAEEFVEALAAQDVNSPEFGKRVDQISATWAGARSPRPQASRTASSTAPSAPWTRKAASAPISPNSAARSRISTPASRAASPHPKSCSASSRSATRCATISTATNRRSRTSPRSSRGCRAARTSCSRTMPRSRSSASRSGPRWAASNR